MTDTQKALAHLAADIEYLEETYADSKRPADQRSIDYEFGNLDLTLGDLKVIKAALEAKAVPVKQHWVTVRNENPHYIIVSVNGTDVIREVFVTGESQMHHSFNMTDLIQAAQEEK